MRIIWLAFILICVKAASDIFVETSRNCYESVSFEKRKDVSLSHCGMICLTRWQCQSFSYDKSTQQCRLHEFLASECSSAENDTRVTLQRKQSGSCQIETYDQFNVPNGGLNLTGQNIAFDNSMVSEDHRTKDVLSECGKNVLVLPFVFEMTGFGFGGLDIELDVNETTTLPWMMDFLLMIEFELSQYSAVLRNECDGYERPNTLNDMSAKTMDIFKVLTCGFTQGYNIMPSEERLGAKDVFIFWINLNRQLNGTVIFNMGQGRKIGNDIIFNKTITTESINIRKATAKSTNGYYDWKFY